MGGKKWERREGERKDSNSLQDAIRQGKILFFFPNEMERKLCKKKRRRGEEGGEERWVFDLFSKVL